MTELLYPRDQSKDPVGQRFSWIPDFVLKVLNLTASLDGCRTPMQWEPGENAGFTRPGTETWLPINQDSNRMNVSSEMAQSESLLNLYRNLLRIRREYNALHLGSIEIIEPDREHPQLLAYKRQYKEYTVLVLINFGDFRCVFVNDSGFQRVILKVGDINQNEAGVIEMGPLSAVIYTC